MYPGRDSSLLSEQWLRACMAQPVSAPPVTSGDGWLWRPASEIRPAAVMIPIVAQADGLQVLLTVRTDHLYDHAGQISFPGGRSDPEDRTPVDTALRETAEEIGLAAERVEVLGSLSEYVTVTGYRVTPVVGLIREPFDTKLDPFEVAEVFQVPLAFIVDPRNQQRHTVVHRGRERQYYAIPYGMRYIWGATAGMLMNFCRHLAAAPASR